MTKHWKRLTGSILVVCVLYYSVLPWYEIETVGLLSKNGPENEADGREYAKHLATFGNRAISPILASIRTNSPWVRRYCYLPLALNLLGPPAQEALRTAIDNESEPDKRGYLIGALVQGFGDPSRLAPWVRDVQDNKVSTWAVGHMAGSVKLYIAGAPSMVTGDEERLNPAFLQWLEHQ